jgi:hypothetical protein
MGYTHYWKQSRAFTPTEWAKITAEAKRIVAKAQRGMYSGPETADTASSAGTDKHGFRTGFAEEGAWRTFPHEEIATPTQGKAIAICGPLGTGRPQFTSDLIALNGSEAAGEDYESFVLKRAPSDGFAFCKTEYRPYDPVVVSILAAAKLIAPGAIRPSSDGGEEAIRLMF